MKTTKSTREAGRFVCLFPATLPSFKQYSSAHCVQHILTFSIAGEFNIQFLYLRNILNKVQVLVDCQAVTAKAVVLPYCREHLQDQTLARSSLMIVWTVTFL